MHPGLREDLRTVLADMIARDAVDEMKAVLAVWGIKGDIPP